MSKNLAPIILFAYNRPWHVKQTLESLSKNKEAAASDLFIYVDGNKPDATPEQIQKNKEVKTVIRQKKWCKSITIFESDINKGLQKSVIEGINKHFLTHNKVIIIEDDVLLSPFFLQFMNESLDFYEQNDKVLSIGSWNYFSKLDTNFFLNMPDTIAWATWKRAWKLFDENGEHLYNELNNQNLMHKFNLDGQFDFEKMLLAQCKGEISSWAIRWTASAVLNDTLTLYPSTPLSKHIGFGNESTNCEGEDYNKNLKLATAPIAINDIELTENIKARADWLYVEREIKHSGAIINNSSNANQGLFIILKKVLKRLLGLNQTLPPPKQHGWFGNYPKWEDAQKHCTGYDNIEILEKVKNSILKVKSGEDVYERDSVLFDEIQYSQPLLDAFKTIAKENNHHLNVIDFGGSLGSTYFQNKPLLKDLKNLQWNVVEQAHFVECGQQYIQDEHLQFYYSIEEALTSNQANVLLLSSVIAYFEHPYQLIEQCLQYEFDYIIVDRTAFIEAEQERITVQIVPEFIYKASYPAWFFHQQKFVDAFTPSYSLINEFDSKFDPREQLDDGVWSYRKGFVFKKQA